MIERRQAPEHAIGAFMAALTMLAVGSDISEAPRWMSYVCWYAAFADDAERVWT